MKYGRQFCELLNYALEREESELKAAESSTDNRKQSVHSVSQYYESWVSVPLLKQAIHTPSCPQLAWEQNRVDLCFIESDRTLATFELKPFFEAKRSNRVWLHRIIADFGKQYEQCKVKSTIEHYVVLVPWGSLDGIGTWTEELIAQVRHDFPAILVEEIPILNPIRLNRDGEMYARVEGFRVTVTTH